MPIHLPDLAATEALAARIAALAKPGDTITLNGTLGVGKSAFARAFIRHATDNPACEVPSPTFSLLQTYDASAGEIWHMDLYRLESSLEALELGIEDGFAYAICLIEWPGIIQEYLPEDHLKIELAMGDSDNSRNATLTSTHPRWQNIL